MNTYNYIDIRSTENKGGNMIWWMMNAVIKTLICACVTYSQ